MWNVAAATARGHHAEFLTNAPVSEAMVDRHRRLVDSLVAGRVAPLRVLDVGAGSGALSAAFAAAGHEVTAIEPSSALDDATGARFGFRVLRGSWPDPRLRSEHFDLVVCVQVLEHTSDPVAVIESILAALAPGGTAYVEVPSGDWVQRHASPIDVHVPHVHYFASRSFARVVQRAGGFVVASRDVIAGRDVGYEICAGDGQSSWSAGIVPDAGEFARSVERLRDRVAALPRGRTAIYGANAGTQALLGWVPQGPWGTVLDDTPAYWGHRVYSSAGEWPISDPDTCDLANYECVVIAAYVHDTTIAARLRARGFRGTVWSLRPATAVTDGPPSLFAD